MFRQCYYSYLLLVENRPPVDSGHQRHVVNLLVDFSVEGAVLQPAIMEVDDAGVTRGQRRCKETTLIIYGDPKCARHSEIIIRRDAD